MSKLKKETEETVRDVETPDKTYLGWYRESLLTGSSVICNPPPDTDIDYLFLVGEGAVGALESRLEKDGWEIGGSLPKGRTGHRDLTEFDTFESYRKGKFNLLLTGNDEYFFRFGNATRLAKQLNLLKKEDRIALFEAVVRDKYPEESNNYYKILKTGNPNGFWRNAVRNANLVLEPRQPRGIDDIRNGHRMAPGDVWPDPDLPADQQHPHVAEAMEAQEEPPMPMDAMPNFIQLQENQRAFQAADRAIAAMPVIHN